MLLQPGLHLRPLAGVQGPLHGSGGEEKGEEGGKGRGAFPHFFFITS